MLDLPFKRCETPGSKNALISHLSSFERHVVWQPHGRVNCRNAGLGRSLGTTEHRICRRRPSEFTTATRRSHQRATRGRTVQKSSESC
jgi:hypothetical protein